MTVNELFEHLIDLRDLAASEGCLLFAAEIHCAAVQIHATADLFGLRGEEIGAELVAAYGRMVASAPWGERQLSVGDVSPEGSAPGGSTPPVPLSPRLPEPNSTNDAWHRPRAFPRPTSGQPCGCDAGAGWACERHRGEIARNAIPVDSAPADSIPPDPEFPA